MASLGTFLLLASFVVCGYAAAASVAGVRSGRPHLAESAIGALHLVSALLAAASVVLVSAFLNDDFSIRYVAHYSDRLQLPF
jgi:cytochrome c-type biogenesis protein CcmF